MYPGFFKSYKKLWTTVLDVIIDSINLVSEGQELKTNRVKGLGTLLQHCCSERGKARGGRESLAHSGSEIQHNRQLPIRTQGRFFPLGSWFCSLGHEGSSCLKLWTLLSFLPVEVQAPKGPFSFVLSLSLSVQADSVSANSIFFKRKKKGGGGTEKEKGKSS